MRTEERNPDTADIDLMSTSDALRIINSEDARIAKSVEAALPVITDAVDRIVPRLMAGGRMIYVGAGTSGRVGVLDAAQCPSAFGVSADSVQAVIAGGFESCHEAREEVEDEPQLGAADLRRRGFTKGDVVVGLTASGNTLYTVGALRFALSRKALTVGITCNPNSDLSRVADITIELDTGPEVIAGSTCLKAATAQKMVLNMLSTMAMVRLGYVYSNWMIHFRVNSRKRNRRALRVLMEAGGLDRDEALSLLGEAGDVATALVMHRRTCNVQAARQLLEENGSLRAVFGETERS